MNANGQITPREAKVLVSHFAARGLISRANPKAELPQRERSPERVVKSDAEKICRAVCESFELSLSDLMSPDRPDYIAHPRQVAMYLMREIWGWGWWAIGNYFTKDHGTALFAHKQIGKRMDAYPAFQNKVAAIRKAMEGTK